MLYNLIFIFAIYSNNATSHMVPGFESLNSCVAAAKTFEIHYVNLLIAEGNGEFHRARINWTCVPYKK